ncbi:MAG: hypothetical protein SWE60_07845 [Thermodesulfobacteriota bacterium]|nr:hypothetical protein [Thermodesulfobacteriota bacterium]
MGIESILMQNRLYKMCCDTHRKSAMIHPSDYLMGLCPENAVTQLRNRIDQLEEGLVQVQETFAAGIVNRSDAIDKAREHVMEIELAQQYISCLQAHYDLAP